MCSWLNNGRSKGVAALVCDERSLLCPYQSTHEGHADASPEERVDLNPCNKTAAAMMWCTPPS